MTNLTSRLALIFLVTFGLAAAAEQAVVEMKVEWKERFKVATGSLPKGVVLTPDQSEAWVTNFGHDRSRNIYIYDAKTGKMKKSLSFKGRAVELAFSPDGATAYISNFDTGRLMFIDTATYKITGSVKVGSVPKIVTLSPDGSRIYVSNWESNDISVVDAATREVIGTAKAGKNPRGSDTDNSGKLLFVANFNGNSLSIVDTETLKEVKRLKMHAYPRHVTTTPDGKWVLCSNMGKASNEIAVIDPVNLEVVKWIKVGGGPKVIMVTPDSRFAFTADYTGNSVSIIDLALGRKIATIPSLGKACCGMDLTRDGKILYVTSWFSNELRAFDMIYTKIEKAETAPSKEEN